jgi:hypothetical protein
MPPAALWLGSTLAWAARRSTHSLGSSSLSSCSALALDRSYLRGEPTWLSRTGTAQEELKENPQQLHGNSTADIFERVIENAKEYLCGALHFRIDSCCR